MTSMMVKRMVMTSMMVNRMTYLLGDDQYDGQEDQLHDVHLQQPPEEDLDWAQVPAEVGIGLHHTQFEPGLGSACNSVRKLWKTIQIYEHSSGPYGIKVML